MCIVHAKIFIFYTGEPFPNRWFFPQRPVTGQTGPVYPSNRSLNHQKPIEWGVWFGILNLSGFFGNRSNRSGEPLRKADGFAPIVGKKPWDDVSEGHGHTLGRAINKRIKKGLIWRWPDGDGSGNEIDRQRKKGGVATARVRLGVGGWAK
jgi:hypothetical protein